MRTMLRKGMARGLSLFFSLLLISCQQPPSTVEEEARLLMRQASSYLWEQQAEDGGWHSQTHALLRSGQALTPFILYTLAEAEMSRPSQDAAALDFIRKHLNEAGVLGVADPVIVEYPNYATAYALRVLQWFGLPQDTERIQMMKTYLLNQQFDESRSLPSLHPAFGGWGFGETNLPAGRVGYVDISHTRRVLQALSAVLEEDERAYQRNAQQFLARLQNSDLLDGSEEQYYDGGFHYSPVVGLANKGEVAALPDTTLFLSYATATCDGVLALIASGISLDDVPVRDALDWLSRRETLKEPEGIPTDNPAQWNRVMFFYHLAVRAEVYHHAGWPAGKKQAMLDLLKQRIREDGSFLNEQGAPNKENDPLLASTLALKALHHIAVSPSSRTKRSQGLTMSER